MHPGAAELLQELQERGIKVGIVTRNCRAAVEHILGSNPLTYDVLLTRDDVDAVKPDPAHLLTALRMMGVEPQHVLMVGDAPGDMKAAKANDVLFYPILPGREVESWKRFHDEAFDTFIKGQYAGDYEARLIAEFDARLPESPPWAR